MSSTNKMLDRINDAIEEAIRPILGKGAAMNAAELDVLIKSVCAIEKIKQIEDTENYGESRASYARGNSNSYGRGNSYDDEEEYSGGESRNSYRRGRSSVTGRYVSRDAMPRVEGYSTRRFYDGDMSSRSGGYSGHSIKDRMISQLEKMYDEAQTEHERQTVDSWIRRLEG